MEWNGAHMHICCRYCADSSTLTIGAIIIINMSTPPCGTCHWIAHGVSRRQMKTITTNKCTPNEGEESLHSLLDCCASFAERLCFLVCRDFSNRWCVLLDVGLASFIGPNAPKLRSNYEHEEIILLVSLFPLWCPPLPVD